MELGGDRNELPGPPGRPEHQDSRGNVIFNSGFSATREKNKHAEKVAYEADALKVRCGRHRRTCSGHGGEVPADGGDGAQKKSVPPSAAVCDSQRRLLIYPGTRRFSPLSPLQWTACKWFCVCVSVCVGGSSL